MTKSQSLKALALSLGLAALMAPATPLNAQSRPGGLFGTDPQTNDNSPEGLMHRNRSGVSLVLRNDHFEPAPLGRGLVLLLGAGLGYVALKKKEDEQ